MKPFQRRATSQFGLLRLFLLTAVCASIVGIVRLFRVPISFQAVLAGYFMLLAGYAVLRLPDVIRDLRRQTTAWDRVLQKRQQLTDEVQAIRSRRPAKNVSD